MSLTVRPSPCPLHRHPPKLRRSLTRCEAQKFVRFDLYQDDPHVILFFDLVKFDLFLVIPADLQRVELRKLHWLIGLQKIGFAVPVQNLVYGIISRIEIERDGISNCGRFRYSF